MRLVNPRLSLISILIASGDQSGMPTLVVPQLLGFTVIYSPAAMSLLAVQGLLALQAEKRGVSSRLFLASTGAPAPSRRSVSSGTRTREAARWRGLQERELKHEYTCQLVDTCMHEDP